MTAPSPLAKVGATVSDASRRNAWMDNLRVVVIVGVIGAHVALIYALDVGWYYQERTASPLAEAILAGIFSPGLLFGMGLMFFIAGMATPRGLAAKGPRRFLFDRLWRLGLPVPAYFLLINPAMNFFGDRAMGRGEAVAPYFRNTYRYDLEFGVAWFIAALLVFSVAFAAWRWRHPIRTHPIRPLSRREVFLTMAFIAGASFVVRLVWPFLSTEDLAGLNLWEYPQMVALFALGVRSEERGWFGSGLSLDLRRTCRNAALISIVAAAGLAVGLTISDDPDPFLGGFRVEAVLIPIIEGTIAVSMSLWATDWFQRRWNRSTDLARGAGRASFAAYLTHAPITVVLAVALRDVGMPAEVKFLAVFAIAVLASFALGSAVTRSRVAPRIL